MVSLFIINLFFTDLKFLKQTDDNIIHSKEGESIILACTTLTNHHVEELSIQQNGIVLAKSNRSIVTFSFTPDRYDSFKNYKCVGKKSQWADVTVNLVINYAPNVDVVVREQRIDCVPNGYPKTYIFSKWEHQSEQGIHIRYLDGLRNGTLDLQPLSQQYQLNGIYVCSVSNGILDLNGSVFQKGFGSLSYSGAPIFVTENRKGKLVVPGEHFTMSFLIYSNPIVDKIWIGMAGTDLTKAIRMNFGISKADLIQAASRENYKISGYKIIIETDIFRINDVHEYTIWADNTLGVDSYQFRILIDENSNHCFNEDKIQIIASGSIATVIIIYLLISHICFFARVIKRRTMQSNIQGPLNNHAYDEIRPITNQEGNEHLLTTGHQELNQQIGVLQYPQDESATTNRSSSDQMNDNMDNTDISSTVSEQERSSIELHHGNPSELHDNRSTLLHDVTTYNEQISADEPATSTDQDGVAQPFRTGNDQDSSRMSKNSTSSDESNGSTLGCVSFSDGYENPYQSIMTANQETHHYCDLTNIPE
ncbi:Hypothetical predicted protein [Mytilus galloprovincialis]|uniref:Ig-like domain-containing protein n=1 Tax=Mytilus galloprovincialis TaxID=29158 RepID=A0A8B6HKU2_MYTGA|nr:Hypothetical predicted protein [Mytilus galloprovincialis]